MTHASDAAVTSGNVRLICTHIGLLDTLYAVRSTLLYAYGAPKWCKYIGVFGCHIDTHTIWWHSVTLGNGHGDSRVYVTSCYTRQISCLLNTYHSDRLVSGNHTDDHRLIFLEDPRCVYLFHTLCGQPARLYADSTPIGANCVCVIRVPVSSDTTVYRIDTALSRTCYARG